jgi:hypothetical protein
VDRQTLKTAASAWWTEGNEAGQRCQRRRGGAVRNLGASHGPELQKNQAVSKVY